MLVPRETIRSAQFADDCKHFSQMSVANLNAVDSINTDILFLTRTGKSLAHLDEEFAKRYWAAAVGVLSEMGVLEQDQENPREYFLKHHPLRGRIAFTPQGLLAIAVDEIRNHQAADKKVAAIRGQ